MSAVTKWEHYLWWNNWKKLNLRFFSLRCFLEYNRGFWNQQTSFWNFQFCSNEFVNFKGCKFSCTTFQESNQCKHSTFTIPFHFTFVHCHSHLKGEVEVGQKRIKTSPPVLQPIFLFGPTSHPFWGWGDPTWAAQTKCQMTKSTGNRNFADSNNCIKAQSKNVEKSPRTRSKQKKEQLSDNRSIVADFQFFRFWFSVIRVSERCFTSARIVWPFYYIYIHTDTVASLSYSVSPCHVFYVSYI